MARLGHAGLQMAEVAGDLPPEIPDEVVEVAALHAALPVAAQDGVQLAGKQTWQIEQPYLERYRRQQGKQLVVRQGLRIGIQLDPDPQLLQLRKTRAQIVGRADQCVSAGAA